MKYSMILNVILVAALCLCGTFLNAAQQKVREEKLHMQNVDELNQRLLQAAATKVEAAATSKLKALYQAEVTPNIIEAKNALEQNALMLAARNVNEAVITFIRKLPLSFDEKKMLGAQKDINGYTALMMAIEPVIVEKKGLEFRKKRQLKIVGALLDYFESDINAKTEVGLTPLMLAVAHNNEAVVKELLHYKPVGDNPKVDVNAQDKNGVSALIIAVNNEHANIVRLLVQAGAKIDLKDNAGKTAKDYAYNKPEILLIIAPTNRVKWDVEQMRAPLYIWTREGSENINAPLPSEPIAEADFPILPELTTERMRSQSAIEGNVQTVRLHVRPPSNFHQ